MSSSWQLKGQGAANLVFAYCGDDPRLLGHVLRVRKPSAHVPSAIDRFLWNGVLDAANGCAINSELEYMANVMAPLLGQDHVFPGVPVPVPGEIRSLLAAAGGGGGSGGRGNAGGGRGGGGGGSGNSSSGISSFPALIQPDHTTFHCAVAPGYVGVGPAVCLEIKPKWGLHPGEAGTPKGRSPTPLLTSADLDGPAPDPAPTSSSSAPSEQSKVCCPVGPSEESKQDDSAVLRQQYPRYMLHMLYKHVKKGVPITLYNPLDLFSGQLGRMEAALWCLLKSPSNNLSVFRDGVKVHAGANAGAHAHALVAAAASAGSNSPGGHPAPPQQHQHQQQQQQQQQLSDVSAPALERLAAELHGFVAAPEAPTDSTDGSVGGLDGTFGAVAGPPLAEADGPVEPLASALQQQQQQQQPQQHPGGLDVLHTLVRLTALALQQEGVLGRLHQVQALDEVGAGGALELYDNLMGELQSAELPHTAVAAPALAASSATPPEAGDPPATATSAVPGAAAAATAAAAAATSAAAVATQAAATAVAAAEAAAAAAVAAAGAAAAAAAAADSRLAAAATVAAADSRLAALRQYLMSATAKDCGIMVTLQRAVPLTAPSHTHIQARCTDGHGKPRGASPEDLAPALAVGQSQPAPVGGAGAAEQQQQHRHRPQAEAEASKPHTQGSAPGQQLQRRPWVRVLLDPVSGVSYMYKVAFVDLDLKAAAKIPKHLELERSLLGCARENLRMLREMAHRVGWRC
ncbi:hypothetical protein PLESTM_000963800 [Pleodorina starrii]|nr:hypothetical protein PLESTM_000963800 [Pleodorina starrii]